MLESIFFIAACILIHRAYDRAQRRAEAREARHDELLARYIHNYNVERGYHVED
jgi:hypothetical protein